MGIFDRIADQLGDLMAPDEVHALVERAERLVEAGALDDAVTELEAALALRPGHARAAYLLGVVHGRRGELDAAEAAFTAASTSRPDFALAHLALGEVKRRQGRLDEAAESLRHALELSASDQAVRGEALRALGGVYLATGRADKAVRELRKAAALAPSDVELQGLLGRALARRGDLDAARICLERSAAAPRPDVEALLALGGIYRRLGRHVDAEMAYVRALQADPAPAHAASARLGLAEVRLDAGDAGAALGHARALRDDPRLGPIVVADAESVRALAHVLGAAGAPDEALAALDAALQQTGEADRLPLVETALHVALAGDRDARAAGYAELVLSARPGDADALAARALGRLDAGDVAGAADLVAALVAGAPSVEVLLAAARVRLAEKPPATTVAAALLRRAAELAPSDPRPRARLDAAFKVARETLPTDLYALLRAAHRQLARTPELADLAPEASRVVEILDKPLLVTVMGEFNSGKSTFVNALVGEEVAPMGVVPTTATINVFKYGAERGARIVRRDDSVEDIAWDDIGPRLRGLDDEAAKAIKLVEIRTPLPTLERIHVVDTPGLNSILPEHEETAREFIAQADAVIWLFSTHQAGAASEKEAIEKVRAAGKKVLGVLNKIDRVGDGERDEIVRHLEQGFGELVEALVPLSAREALVGRHDPERLARSNRAELDRVLAERFFARSEAIKRAAATRRMGALLDEAVHRADALLDERRAAAEGLGRAAAAVADARAQYERRFLVEERVRLRDELEALLGAAARELLDFVRPRRWALGSHQATPADRDFLVALLEEKLGAVGDASRARVAALAAEAAAGVRAADPAVDESEALRLADFEVYGRYRAFVRGYLRGRSSEFFARVLPRLELEERAIRRALEAELLSASVIDDELASPLRVWAQRFHDGLDERIARRRRGLDLERFEIDTRLREPALAFASAIAAHRASE